MAKTTVSNLHISGKVGDLVYVRTRYGEHVRRAVKPGIKKNDAGLKKQNSRNSYLNNLAGTINKMVRYHCHTIKPATFYERLLSLFRKEPLDNRFLLLYKLRGMEVHPKKPLPKSAGYALTVTQKPRRLVIDLQTVVHPTYAKANCYYYVPILITWTENGKADIDVHASDWIETDGEKPGFEFIFPVYPGITHWLLGLQMIGGLNHIKVEAQWAEGIRFVDAGSYDPNDTLLLEEKEAAKKDVPRVPRKKEEIIRVQARKKI